MPIGDLADAIPIRTVADQVGGEDGTRTRADSGFERVDIDLVGIDFDIDEHRHQPRSNERRDVGRERDGGGEHFVAGLESEKLDCKVERRGTRVDHDAALLGERRRHQTLHLLHVLADAQPAGAGAQHRDDGVDLFFVVHAAGILDSLHARSLTF
jgi:hypothetical protein